MTLSTRREESQARPPRTRAPCAALPSAAPMRPRSSSHPPPSPLLHTTHAHSDYLFKVRGDRLSAQSGPGCEERGTRCGGPGSNPPCAAPASASPPPPPIAVPSRRAPPPPHARTSTSLRTPTQLLLIGDSGVGKSCLLLRFAVRGGVWFCCCRGPRAGAVGFFVSPPPLTSSLTHERPLTHALTTTNRMTRTRSPTSLPSASTL